MKLDPIAVGEWLPDQPDLGNRATVAKNVIPWKDSYKSFPELTTTSNALTARAQGGFFARDSAANVYNFAGDATTLYQLLDGNSYSDVTRTSGVYSTAVDDWWEFIQWGETVIATNYTDDPQLISLGAGNFVALPGSPPKARHIDVVRDFVVLGNITDAAVNYPNRVMWSGINDSESWTVSAATMADYQDLQGDGGWVQKIVGGEYGLVFQERAIWRMTFVGSPLIFQFDKIENKRGAFAPQSVIGYGGVSFYLADDGFYVTNGASNSVPIGDGKIDRYFLDNLDTDYWYRVNSTIDPINKLVMWGVPFTGNTGGRPNNILVYNWVYKKWGLVEVDTECFARFASVGYTLDGLDAVNSSIDALSPSLDSRTWAGGTQSLAAFDSSHQLATFSGAAMDATVETGEVEHYPGYRAHVLGVRPIVDQNAATVTIGSRNLLSAAHSFGSVLSQNGSGECPSRSNARYHRYRISTTGSFDFVQGVVARCERGEMR